jgi:type III pantothenate kinase
MNIIAIDIGNTNIGVGLFLDGTEDSVHSIPGESEAQLRACLIDSWGKIPVLGSSKEKKRDGVIVVSSVKPVWTDLVRRIADEDLGENIRLIGEDIPLPITVWVDDPKKVGTDRVVAAAAAFDVVEDAVVVADFGTAVTIDLVDAHGVFQGGVICPGFDISAQALKDNTAQLPKVMVHRPSGPYGKNTADAINCGLDHRGSGGDRSPVRGGGRPLAPDDHHRLRRRNHQGRLPLRRQLRPAPGYQRRRPGVHEIHRGKERGTDVRTSKCLPSRR